MCKKQIGLVICIYTILSWGQTFSQAQLLSEMVPIQDNLTHTNLQSSINTPTQSATVSNSHDYLQTTQNYAYGNSDVYVDENRYYLGSGDVLSAIIWGVQETKLTITVAGDGTCVIPTVGAFDIPSSVPLRKLKKDITDMIKKKYKTSRIDIFISQIKSLDVPTKGHVAVPGTYTVSGITTIPALIEGIGGFAEDANIRKIHVIHPDHDIRTIDVLKSNRILGQEAYIIQSGDQIYVPMRTATVHMSGAILYPDTYDFVEGDTLGTLLSLSGGLALSADSSRVIITRFIGNQDSIVTFDKNIASDLGFPLMVDDRITISPKPDYRPYYHVKILGEVNYPGSYTIQEDKTRLVDVIKMAGGLTTRAFLQGSRLTRTDFVDAGSEEYTRLAALQYSELSPDEKIYLKYRTTENSSVLSIDFAEFAQTTNDANNVVLRSGDEIHIGKKDLTINVMGAVTRPGLVTFQNGESLAYYIGQAGGYKKGARRTKVKVIKVGSEIWLHPRQINKIEEGDAIWIPERQHRDGMETTRNIFAIIGGIATLVTASIAILSYINDN